jgi:serine/threonine-protein kinase
MSTVRTDDWRRAAVLFERALDQPRELRGEFLRRVCGADCELQATVESLLALDEETEDGGSEADPLDAGLPMQSDPPHLEGYRLLEPIGQGGMGRVWLAERTVDDVRQQVAVKLMDPAGHPGLLRLFRRERQILARLEHPNIARFLDGGATGDGIPFVVLEYVEGAPVIEACDARRLGVRQRLELFLKICRAVQYAHESLVVHSDLKPRNVLVTDAGEPKLLDFGIARLLDRPRSPEATVTRAGFLTPEYASPEQLAGQPVSTASDVYSLGVILYELLTGRQPYDPLSLPRPGSRGAAGPLPPSEAVRAPAGDLPADEIASLRGVSAQRLRRQLRGDVDQIVLRCLRIDPRERYRSVEQLTEDLRRHLAGLPVLTRAPSLGYRLGKLIRREWPAVTAAALLAFSLAALLAVIVTSSHRVTLERDRALQSQRAESLLEWGRLLKGKDDYRGAEAALGEALALRRQQSPPDPQSLGRVLLVLGEVLRLHRREEAAESALREALKLLVPAVGEENSAIADTLYNLGMIQARKGASDAKDLLRRSFDIRQKLYGPEHPETLTALSGLADYYFMSGRYAESEIFRRELLARDRKVKGSHHPDVANDLSDLGQDLFVQGDLAAAEPLIREALGIAQKRWGAENPMTLTYTLQLGMVLSEKGAAAAAEPLLWEALEGRRKSEGSQGFSVARSSEVLADFLARTGHPQEALPLAQQAVETFTRHPKADVYRAMARSVLGDCLVSLHRFAEAEPHLLSTLETLEHRRGFDAERQARLTRERVVHLYEAWGRPEQAAAYRTATTRSHS